jgi:hypothetical protein
MIESSTVETAESTRQVPAPGKSSDLLAVYGRLLALYSERLRADEVNPYQSIPLLAARIFSPAFHVRVWKRAAPFWKTSNTLAQDLFGGDVVLRELEALDDQILRGIAECSRVNLRRLLRRSVLGWFPKLTAGAAAVVALAKAVKDGIGVDVPASLTSAAASLAPVAVAAFVGLLLGSMVNVAFSMPKLGFVQAVDDLIAIAAAHRGGPRKG